MHAAALVVRESWRAEEAEVEVASRAISWTSSALISHNRLIADSCADVASLGESVRAVTPAEGEGRVAEQEVAKRAGRTSRAIAALAVADQVLAAQAGSDCRVIEVSRKAVGLASR